MQEIIKENEEKEVRVLRKNKEREEQLRREYQNQVEQLRRENKQLEEEQRRKNEERLAFLLLENETQLANLVAKQEEEEEEKKKEEGVSRKRKVEELETNKQPAAPECPVCLFEFQLFVCCSNSVTGLPRRDGSSHKDIQLCQWPSHLRDLQVSVKS